MINWRNMNKLFITILLFVSTAFTDTLLQNQVLFIGNSYTYFNGGVNAVLDSLITEATPNSSFSSQVYARPAYTLKDHFRDDSLIHIINSQEWDLVILQEQSSRPIMHSSEMYRYAKRLNTIISKTQAKTGFFMTWGRENDSSMINELSFVYNLIGEELNAEVFPVGIAFKNVLELHPTINLYSKDGSHPSYAGTYLSACVFFSLLLKESPEGLTYFPFDSSLSNETIKDLQRMAWKTVTEYRNDL